MKAILIQTAEISATEYLSVLIFWVSPPKKLCEFFSSSVLNLAWNSLQNHISHYQQLFALWSIPLLQDLQSKKLSLSRRFSLWISLISANKREIVFFRLTAMNQYCVTQGTMRLHRRGQPKVSLRSKGFMFFRCKMTKEVVQYHCFFFQIIFYFSSFSWC